MVQLFPFEHAGRLMVGNLSRLPCFLMAPKYSIRVFDLSTPLFRVLRPCNNSAICLNYLHFCSDGNFDGCFTTRTHFFGFHFDPRFSCTPPPLLFPFFQMK